MAETTTVTHAKLVIIGSGPAGYTAAIYAARAMLEPILIQGIQPGGQLTITTDVENYPGFADVIQGPWLMEQMQKQAEHVGTKIVTDHVNDLDLTQRPFRLTCDSGEIYLADAVVLATGAQARWLDLPSEQKFKGYGVSACATCDGFFYKNKEVIVIGGGNTAVEEALFLTNFASKVTVVHRRDAFRAEKILQDRLFKHPKISVIWDSALHDVLGNENPLKVRGVALRNVKTGAIQEMTADGVFIAIGHSPSTELVAGKIKMKPNGYVWTAPYSTATSVPGAVRRRRRDRRHLPPGGDRRGLGLHGRAGGRTIPRASARSSSMLPNETAPHGQWKKRDGLGQAEGVPRRGGSRQLHACRRAARAVAVGGVAAGQRARAGIVGFAVPSPRPGADPHRAGRTALSHRP